MMVRLSISIKPEDQEKLLRLSTIRTLAENRHVAIAELAREAIDKLLTESFKTEVIEP